MNRLLQDFLKQVPQEEKEYEPSLITNGTSSMGALPASYTKKFKIDQRVGADTVMKYISQNFPQYKNTQIPAILGYQTAEYVSDFTDEEGENYIRRTVPFNSYIRVLHAPYQGRNLIPSEEVFYPDGRPFYKIYAQYGNIDSIIIYLYSVHPVLGELTTEIWFEMKYNILHNGEFRLSLIKCKRGNETLFNIEAPRMIYNIHIPIVPKRKNIIDMLDFLDPSMFTITGNSVIIANRSAPIGVNPNNYTMKHLLPYMYSLLQDPTINEETFKTNVLAYYKKHGVFNEYLNNFLINFAKIKITCNEEGFIHSFNDKPAVEITDLTTGSILVKQWFNNGVLHRGLDKPAIVEYDVFGNILMEEWHGTSYKMKRYNMEGQLIDAEGLEESDEEEY